MFFKISMNPMVRVEMPQPFQTWAPPPPIAASHAQSLCFSTDIPGHWISRTKRCLKPLIAGVKGEIIIIRIACSSERAGHTSRDAVEQVSLGRRAVQQHQGLSTPLM